MAWIIGKKSLEIDKHFVLKTRFVLVLCCISAAVNGQIRYSIPEEMKPGLFVGDVAKDLGLDVKRLVSGRARLVIDDSKQYVDLNRIKGHLLVKERVDREQLCGQKSPCSFGLEIVFENPLEFFSVTIEIEDINDHAPAFFKNEIILETSESAPIGTIFILDTATDPDVGLNSLQTYGLKPLDYFALKQHTRVDGSKYAQLVLQSPLDREKNSEHLLILTAVDGGIPPRSGTVKIRVNVLDANDNIPIFTQSVYRASVNENTPPGTLIVKTSATDEDQGLYGNVTYTFTNLDDTSQVFRVDAHTGEIILVGILDYEMVKLYEMNLLAKDSGGLSGTSKLFIDVVDVNDNIPFIDITFFSGKLPEHSPSGTVVALINVHDLDSGKNGNVHLNVEQNAVFIIKPSPRKFYTLVTYGALDREKKSSFNLTLTASDEGTPSLSSKKTIVLEITDVNDNPPVFSKWEYRTNIIENNSPGVSVLTIQGTDADAGQNARIAYYLIDTEIGGSSVSSYFSVNADNGVLHAMRSFDFEQVKEFKIQVRAQDGGSPPLSSNATVIINIQDQNDNAPQVLYPVQTGSSVVAEMVPRSADVEYLVTKIVAVDVDSGQNAWLSYKLQRATDRVLFEVGIYNGEIRTVRQITDKDAVKQKLTVVVADNGEPSRSSTVNVNVVLADSFPEMLSDFTDFTGNKEYTDHLTFYLILTLAAVSFLFITCLIVIMALRIYQWRQFRMHKTNLPVIPYYPPCYIDSSRTGTLKHVDNCDVFMSTDLEKCDVKHNGQNSQSLLRLNCARADFLLKETYCDDNTEDNYPPKPVS